MSDNNSNNPGSTSDNVSGQVPPAGWYPDPHDAATQRFWDGARWTEHIAVRDSAATTLSPAEGADAVTAGGALAAAAPRGLRSLKWWQWALIGFGALVLVSIIVNAVSGGRGNSLAEQPVSTATAEMVEPEPEPVETVDDRAEVPALTGKTVAEARAALEAAGFVLAVPDGTGDDWVVSTQTLSEGRKADAGAEVFVTAEAPKPVYTLSQQNAIRQAKSYLEYSGFSRTGLIDQLEYEGYSTEDATFGADNAGADWAAEAAETAASYLEYSSFSRQGLYDQLAYEGFTDAEIQYGLAAVGY